VVNRTLSYFAMCLLLVSSALACLTPPKASPEMCSLLATAILEGKPLQEESARVAAFACDPATRELYCKHAPDGPLQAELCGQ
jgi:hypothetical protein